MTGVYSKTWETSTREHTPDLGFFGVFEDFSEHTKCSLLTSPVDIQPVHIFFGLTVFPNVFGMSVPFIARVSGPLVEEKVCISQCSGEILWPTKNIYEVAFGGYQPPIPSSPRQKCHTN